MLVSRKSLSLIHFVPGETLACLHMLQALHQRIKLLGTTAAHAQLFEPFAEDRVQSFVLRFRDQPRLLDQAFIGAQSNIPHTELVYTVFV